MKNGRLSSIAIVGGDISAWAAAAWLASSLKGLPVKITLLELPDMVNAEPMQYTVPETLRFFAPLGIDIDELIRLTGATYRLGTGLHGLSSAEDHRILAFGRHGSDIGFVHFHHFITRAHLRGEAAILNDYSPNAVAARNGKFIRSDDAGADKMPPLAYGLNFNTEKLTQLLCEHATISGVGVVSSRIDSVQFDPEDGRIESLLLEDKTSLAADLFIDCSGEDALLIGEALGVGFEDWSAFLPCSRSIAVTAKTDYDNIPVHHCTATDEGWFLSTPLQYRTACQFRYAPTRVSDEAAASRIREFVGEQDPDALAISNVSSGHRQQLWQRNCVALGAAAGWVEPLDISNFHLLMSGLSRLTQLMPTLAMEEELAAEYNRAMLDELECSRDFTVLHYLSANWRQSDFWQAGTKIPESLQGRLDLFQSRGRVWLGEHETFPRETWAAAFLAAEIWPRGYDPLLDSMNAGQLQQHFANMKHAILQAVHQMPDHRDYALKASG
jgi:tryptophan halogenase